MMSGLPEHNASTMHLDAIDFDEAETFPALFQQRVARTPDSIGDPKPTCNGYTLLG